MPNLTPIFQKYLPRLFKPEPVQIQKLSPLIEQAAKSMRPVSSGDVFDPSLALAYHLEANVSIFADIVLTLKQEVSRRGMVWKPRFACKCPVCGSEYIEEKQQCDCGCMTLQKPDRTQIQKFRNPNGKSFTESANLNGQSLESILEENTRHGVVGDRIYLLCVKRYKTDPVTGEILASVPVEFVPLDPRDIEPIEQDNGLPGGKYWICLDHRDESQGKPGVCKHNGCGKKLYEVMYQTTGLSDKKKYFIDDEIKFAPVYYPRKGYPPILKMIYDAYSYHYMELRTYNYHKKGRPPGFLAFPTNNPASLKTQWDALLLEAQNDPDEPRAMGYDPGGAKGTAQFIKLMNDPGPEMLEVKKDLRERMGSMFGVSLIFQGDASTSGGLNNEGLQITVTNRATEFLQKPWNGREQNNYKDGILYWIVSQFGITDFVLQLLPSEEQDEMAEKQRFNQDATNAKLMLDMGFDVKFENNKFTYSGQAKKPEPPSPFGGLPGLPPAPAGEPQQQEPRVSGAPQDVHKDADIKNPEPDELAEYQDLISKAFIDSVLQAIRAGALYGSYEGVSSEDVASIHKVIRGAFMQKRLSLKEMIDAIVKETAVTPEKARLIVRTETHNISQLARKIDWQNMEIERGEPFVYKWSVKHDHRTSPQCVEIEQRVGEGKSLDEVQKIIQEVAQKYIPNWKAEMTPHPNCRSTLVRKV